MSPEPTFEVEAPANMASGETLVVGLSHSGMAGLTAADYLVRHLPSEEIGYVDPVDFPAIAPFQAGEPRRHTRLYRLTETPILVLVGELFVPTAAAGAFADGVMDWVSAGSVEEIAVLHGVPFPHGPEEHAVFHVATNGYRTRRLEGTDLEPLAGGFLDGVVGELVTRCLDDAAPHVGVFVTPTHQTAPDVKAALLLLGAIQSIYGFTVDEDELETIATQMDQYYAELADRMQALEGADQSIGSRDFPEDRMYM